ncbi:MAG: glycoside hydrolase family 2, partial [Bacteroidales bacterium]|nr:glycoside hydrolase family 2 [Bacteroidales bacterium]
DGSEMLFLCNTSRYHAHQTKIGFHHELTHRKHPWVWDLHTGERHPLSLDEDDSYDFDLGPAESMLIVFEKKPFDGSPKTGDGSQKTFVGSRKTALTGWEVEFDHARLDTSFRVHLDTLFDLKDHPDYQHFAGTVIYRKTLSQEELKSLDVTSHGCILDLGRVEGVSEVFVNGRPAGVKYYGRRIYGIGRLLHEGDNVLEIKVTTTLGNYLKTLGKEENPTTWVYVNHPKRDQALQPMGLVGPIALYSAY